MTQTRRPLKPTLLAAALGLLLQQAPALAQTQPAPDPASTPAPAQDDDAQAQPPAAKPQADEAKQLDTVQVTGYRYSIEKSLDQKRDANAVVDVITAEDVSKFPDKNVADALQRVPGVIIERDGGEGKRVSVRGLSSELTLTELNGNYIATAESNGDPTRSFNYTLLPSNMLSSAELFKTPEARIDEGGIGGTVILHTRRPLDMPSGTGFVTIEGTQSDTSGTMDPQTSAMFSWHTDDDRFGILVGATQQTRTTRTMGASTENWTWYGDDYDGHPATDVNGKPSDFNSYWWGESGFNSQNHPYDGPVDESGHAATNLGYYNNFMMPTSVNFNVNKENRERKGGQLTMQFKPTDNLTLTANYFRFDLSQNSQSNVLKIPEWSLARYYGDGNWLDGRMLDGLNFDPSGTIVTGAQYSVHDGKFYPCNEDEAAAAGLPSGGWGSDSCALPTPQITGSYNLEKARSQTFDIGADWHGEALDASFKAGRTWAKGGPELQFTMPIKPRRGIDGTPDYTLGNYYSAWDLTGTPSMTFSPELMDNLKKGIYELDLGSSGSSWTRNTTKQKYAQADFTWHTDGGWIDSLQFGVKYRDGGIHRNTGNNYWVCPGTDPSNYDNRFAYGSNPCPELAKQFPADFLYAMGNLAGGIDASAYPAINFPGYIGYLNQTYGPMQTRDEPNFVYNVGEKIASGYFQLNFRTERLRGNVGVRVARTKQHADSTDRVDYYNDYFFDDANGNPVPCVDGNAAPGAPQGSGCVTGYTTLPDSNINPATGHVNSYALSTLDRTYTDVLPSFNLAYDLTDNLLLRAAASKVIARPSYDQIAAPGSLVYCSQEYIDDRSAIGGGACSRTGWFGSGSNKKLEPYKAVQYDLALEWYFRPGSVVGVDLFRKNVSNFGVNVVQDVTMDVDTSQIFFNGVPVTVQNPVVVQNYSTQAGGRDGVSQGVELYAQHTLDFGLGFQFNYTYNDTNEAAITLADGTSIGKSPLVGSAKNQTNFTVFYENKNFLARASYNRRGEVVDGLENGLNVYEEPYSQIDLNASYTFLDNMTVSASVLNLTKEESRSHLGNDTTDRFYSNGYSGRIYYVGLTYKF